MVNKKVAFSVMAAIPAMVVPSVFTDSVEAAEGSTNVSELLETNYMKYAYKDIEFTPTGAMVTSNNTYEVLISSVNENENKYVKIATQNENGKIILPIKDIPNGMYQVQVTEMDSKGNHIASHVFQNNLMVQKDVLPNAELPSQEEVKIHMGTQIKNENKQYVFSGKLKNTNPQISYTNTKNPNEKYVYGLERNELHSTIVEAKTKNLPSGVYDVTVEFYNETDKFLGEYTVGKETIGEEKETTNSTVDSLLTSNIENNEITKDILLTPTKEVTDTKFLAILQSKAEGTEKPIYAEFEQGADGTITIPLAELDEGTYSLQISVFDKTGKFIVNELWKDNMVVNPSTPPTGETEKYLELTGAEIVKSFENNFVDNKITEDIKITPTGKAKAIGINYEVIVQGENQANDTTPTFYKVYKPTKDGSVIIPMSELELSTGKYSFQITQLTDKGEAVSTTLYATQVAYEKSDKDYTKYTKEQLKKGFTLGFHEVIQNNTHITPKQEMKNIDYEIVMTKQPVKEKGTGITGTVIPHTVVFSPQGVDNRAYIEMDKLEFGYYQVSVRQLDKDKNILEEVELIPFVAIDKEIPKDIPEYSIHQLGNTQLTIDTAHTLNANNEYVIAPHETQIKLKYEGLPQYENLLLTSFVDGNYLGTTKVSTHIETTPLIIVEDISKDKVGEIVLLFEDSTNPKAKAKYVMKYGYADVLANQKDNTVGNNTNTNTNTNTGTSTEQTKPTVVPPTNFAPQLDIVIEGGQKVGRNKYEVGKDTLTFTYTALDKDDAKSTVTVSNNFNQIYEETVKVNTKTTGKITQLGFSNGKKEIELAFNVRDSRGAYTNEYLTFIYNPELDKDSKDENTTTTKPNEGNTNEKPNKNETTNKGEVGKEGVSTTPSPSPTPSPTPTTTEDKSSTSSELVTEKEAVTPQVSLSPSTPTPSKPSTSANAVVETKMVNSPTTVEESVVTTEKVNSEGKEEKVNTASHALPQTNTKSQGMAVGMFGAMLSLLGAVGLYRRKSDNQTEN